MFDLISDTIWQTKLTEEFEKPYFKALEEFVKKERSAFTIYPKEKETFAALNLTPLKEVKVIIIGQDPYHGPRQAHGLSFSVNYGIKPPPSLVNIFKELRSDIGCPMPNHGNLSAWAKQGVLLLNATLTVRAGEPGSHQKKGWELFTDKIIQTISDEQKNCVFLLWGNFARTKAPLIDSGKHLILEAAHPSPLARGAFFGCGHFSKANSYLESKKRKAIDWNLPNYDLFEQGN
ncbi:MAG: uracil-DNA glycosylase [Bacteroidetes bacterium]|jgi:uracil-DNA glycosylase|nr:uracil-DNA glycosylase [Bacteroidota bacterium]MDF2452029.1 uracil-DNA glycosylase [Bacteroidota bacterium]